MFLYVKAIVCKSVGSVSNLCVKSQLCVGHVCMYQHACMQKCMSHFFFLCLLRFILLFFLLQFLYTYLLFTTRLRHVFSFHASSYISIFTFHATRSSYLYLSLCFSTLSDHPSSSFTHINPQTPMPMASDSGPKHPLPQLRQRGGLEDLGLSLLYLNES